MKFAKALLNFIIVALTIYIGIFALWFLLEVSCLQYSDKMGWTDNECGQDSLSQIIFVTHSPLIRLLFKI